MFNVIRESLRPGVVTTSYPATPPEVSAQARGRPEIDWANVRDFQAVIRSCPTGAFSIQDAADARIARFDLAQCTFCGLCAEVDPAIRMTNACECAARSRAELVTTARYSMAQGTAQPPVVSVGTDPSSDDASATGAPVGPAGSLPEIAHAIQKQAAKRFGRSLHIRQVDAGSCNGCEMEIVNLTGPIYDLERFGIHFVASPRHADMLLVTGPVTRNMELAVRKTYAAMPAPRLVVAVGACGCSGGIFGENYATCGAVDAVLPVDVFIPGCPPNPFALLHGILLAIGRRPERMNEPGQAPKTVLG